ncbi:hypothetical protein MMC21_008399 [Puttea exsequens]|nr:hypothetical protein [Puttea exsequens]
MVDYRNVKQGTGQIFVNPIPPEWVGTDGAVTCLEIYMNVVGQGVFVAHADSNEQVPGPGPAFDYVKDDFAQQLVTALGPFNAAVHTQIQCFSGGTDPAMEALKAGLQQWSGAAPLFVGRDSFRLKEIW